MKYGELSIRFCGIAGDGIVSSGKILAAACAGIGLQVMVNDIYSAEIRGSGKSTTTVRFAADKVHSMGDGIDLLVGMAAKESIAEVKDVKHDGTVIYDSGTPGDIEEESSLAAHIPPEIHGCCIPLERLANEASGTNRGRNLVAVGALCFIYSLPPDMFINQIKAVFSRKGEKIVETNIKAFRLGYLYCEEHYPLNHEFEIKEGAEPRRLISGNEALHKGALDCGLHFFAGYPITPATKIMELAAKELPKLDGWCIQVEDEIAAISAVVGASFAGKRAMTATSGPGLCLMSEMINLAVMAEIPAVIVNVQRGGPSTGLPTKVEQGDLNIALYGASGDSPRVVMAPTDSEDCYSGIQLALDLAEKYQTPVIFLSDLFLGQRYETADIKEEIDRRRCTRKKPTPEQLEDYLRYRVTDDGVSPLIVPGERGAIYTITGLEHTVKGTPNYEAEVHTIMTAKRHRKFESMKSELPRADILGDKDAQIGIAGWGSTIGAILEGMGIARKQGVKSKLIKSIMIHPQHESSFREFFASCKRIIVPEMNYQGQYAALLKTRYCIEPIEIHIPAVDPVSPGKISEKIMEAHHELSK
ncbi:MAG: 2-oxoacid:acceptor oxidoreductase subunit alpha [Candidatus Aminicenantes bacterium]|nr:2-oxoacid:acceptor oxidoreductase subunit alpha [Candidatus Aminicenantes bacterium]